MTEIGKGSRRVCLRLPDSRLCVKRYRDDDGVGETVKREIARFRFDRRRSTCAQEYDYIRSLAAKLPPEVFAVFPETMELRDDPVHGWHLVESLVLNGDGSVPERFSRTCRAADADTRQRLLCAFRDLAHAFEAAAVRFYDPQNVLVQWEGGPFEGAFRLRIVDFEPASRAFLPVDLLCPALRRMKLRRRVRRYLWQHVAAKYNPLPWRERAAWDAIIAEKGPGMGLSGCRAFLENKLVNDIFYEGLFNGKPCIVKCSSRAPESIENEYELASRMHAADPVHFPDVYAFSPGPMAFVVVEKIAGGRIWRRPCGDSRRAPRRKRGPSRYSAVQFSRCAGRSSQAHRLPVRSRHGGEEGRPVATPPPCIPLSGLCRRHGAEGRVVGRRGVCRLPLPVSPRPHRLPHRPPAL